MLDDCIIKKIKSINGQHVDLGPYWEYGSQIDRIPTASHTVPCKKFSFFFSVLLNVAMNKCSRDAGALGQRTR
jgi:hypothetical protein